MDTIRPIRLANGVARATARARCRKFRIGYLIRDGFYSMSEDCEPCRLEEFHIHAVVRKTA